MGGVQEPVFVFKFEADGYAPLVTRTVLADEIEARFDVRLRAASATTVTVLLPDGTTTAHADIGLISSGARVEIIPGGLGAPECRASGGSLSTADGQGQVRLPPDDAILSCACGASRRFHGNHYLRPDRRAGHPPAAVGQHRGDLPVRRRADRRP